MVRHAIIILLATGGASCYLTRNCVAVANTTIQKELGLDESQMGWVFGAFAVGYFWFQIPGGWLGNRIGTRKALSFLSLLWSAATIWTASVSTYIPLLFSRFAFGSSQAGIMPITAEIIRDWFPESRRGFNIAVFVTALSVGGMFAMGLTAWLMGFWHWRTIFYVYSVVGIVWAVVFFLCFRDLPKQHPWVNQAELAIIQEDTSSAEDSIPVEVINQPEEVKLSAGQVAKYMITSWSMWTLCAQSLFRAAAYSLFASWFPAYLENRFGISPTQAGTYAMYPLGAVICGGLIGGWLVDRLYKQTGSKWISRSGLSVAVFSSSALITIIATWSPNASTFVMLMSFSAFFSGMGSPPAWAATIDISGNHTGAVMGTINMVGTLGDLITKVVLGYVIRDIRLDGGDWNRVVMLLFAVYVACALSWLTVNPNRRFDRVQNS